MSTTTCYACRMTVSTSATRCAHCTTQLEMGTGGDPNMSHSNGFGMFLVYLFFAWMFGWLVWYHLSNFMGWS